MKRLFILVLTLILLGCTAIAEDVQIPVFIDGVRVAFFDAEGNFLMQKKADELVYVPLQSFCESLGMNAEVQGQSVSVDGMRIGMFDASGNFLSPKQFDGIDYIPLLPFCEAMALNASENEGKLNITRGNTTQTVTEENRESTEKIALHPYNFGDYFSYDIQEQNFKSSQTRVKLSDGYIYNNDTEVDYVLTCNARSSFEIENVSFALSAEVWESDAIISGINNVGFNEDMPANGSLTKTVHKTGTAFVSGSGWKATKASLKEIKLYRVSGCIIIDKDKADAANLLSFEKAEKYMAQNSYEKALEILNALNSINYPDADKLQAEANEGLQHSKKQEEERKNQLYQQAKKLETAKDYAAAAKIYESLGYYADSQTKLQECNNIILYESALNFEQNGEFGKAKEIYSDLGTFKDAKSRKLRCEEALLPCEEIGIFSEGLAAIKKDGKYGYISEYGSMIIPRTYEFAAPFKSGLALVKKNGKWGFINKGGQIVVPCEYSSSYNFENGFSIVEKNGKYGFIDTTGRLIVPCEYENVWDYKDGFARVKKNGKWGFVNTDGKIVIPCEYKTAQSFNEGFAVADKDSIVANGFFDTLGNYYEIKGYEIVSYFSDGLILIRDNKTGKLGYANTSGKVVISCQFDSAANFSDGLAFVIKNNKSGFIDKTGKTIASLKYSMVGAVHNGITYARKDGKLIIIDTQGNQIIDKVFDSLGVYADGYYGVEVNGKFGMVNPNGKLEIPCEYSAVTYNEGYYTMRKNGEFFIQKAEEIIPRVTATNTSTNTVNVESSQYKTLKPGSKGQEVLDARMKLYELGYFSKKPTQTEYTNNMKDYVKKFEKDNGLKQDGVLSPEDQEVLFSL